MASPLSAANAPPYMNGEPRRRGSPWSVASEDGSDTKHIASIDFLLETVGRWIDV